MHDDEGVRHDRPGGVRLQMARAPADLSASVENALAARLIAGTNGRTWNKPDVVDPAIRVLAALSDIRRGIRSPLFPASDVPLWPHVSSPEGSGAVDLVTARRDARGELRKLIRYLRDNPTTDSGQDLYLLRLLANSLEDPKEGDRLLLFQPRKVVHRHEDSAFRQVIKAMAIVSIDLLMRFRQPLEKACRYVAHTLERGGFSIGSARSSTQSWVIVRRWRERASRLPENTQQRHTVEGLRCAMDLLGLESLEAARRYVRSRLTVVLATLGPHLP